MPAVQGGRDCNLVGAGVRYNLPKEVLARLKVGKGDSLFVTDLPDGVALRPYDADFAEAMEAAREIMRKRRNVLRELAK